MAKHLVKCPLCGKTFDTNSEPYVMVNSRRYAHESCYQESQGKADKIKHDKEQLELYIKELFGYQKLPDRVNKQIRQYTNEKGYSYSGIYKTLKYWFDIKKGDLEKANGGIGIVPYVYDQARDYWMGIWEARERNKELEAQQAAIITREVRISAPQRKPMRHLRKLFTFLEEEGDIDE